MTAGKRRLGVVLHTAFFHDGDRFYLREVWADYILDALAPWFAQTCILGPVQRDPNGRFQFEPLDPAVVEPVELPTGGSRPARLIGGIRGIARFVRSSDVVWILAPAWRGILAAAICRTLRRDYVVYVGADWNEYPPASPRMRRLRVAAERMMFGGARFILAAGDALLERVRRSGRPTYHRAPPMRLTTDDLYHRDDSIASGPVRLLFVGGDWQRKGVAYLIEAFALLLQRGFDVVLDLVGPASDAERAAIHATIAGHGLGEFVRDWGYLPNGPVIFERYREASILVLPSLAEGFPRVVYEALAHGLPVVATAVGGIPAAMHDGVDCLLVPPGSAGAVADAVGRLIEDPELRRRIVAAGYETVKGMIARGPRQQVGELLNRHGLVQKKA